MADASSMIKNWQQGMGSAQAIEKYKSKIQATRENPMALAAAPDAEAKFLRKVTDSVTSGRRAAKLMSVSPEFWKQQCINIGANNLRSGAMKGLSKFTTFANKFAPVYDQARQAARAIPNDGSDAAITARVLAAVHVMKSAAGKV